MTFDIALEIFHWHFILKTENTGAANLKTKTILCSLDVSCILQLAHWPEIKFKKIVLTLDSKGCPIRPPFYSHSCWKYGA